MQIAALTHICRSPWAYPVGGDRLRVVLMAARGDLERAASVYADRYAWPPDLDEPIAMERLGDDGLHEYWGVTLPAETRRARYFIYVEGKDGERAWLTENGPVRTRPADAQGAFQYAYIHKHDQFAQPEWLRQAVFYQIFPDRFANGDPANDPKPKMKWGDKPTREAMAGGDLAGIRQKMDYLAELGIGCIYTTPIFKSPSNHKYNTSDYLKVDPAFGTNEEFKELVAAAHQHGIRFLLDAVFNHSGDTWFPFRDVIRHGARSRYADWFYQIDSFPVDRKEVNYETFATKLAHMPKLNTGNPELAKYLLKVAEFWISEADIDGWRLDVANEVDHQFWRAFRERVKSTKADAFILGEIWHNPTDWLQGDQFDAVMNYPWRDATLAFLNGSMDPLDYDRALVQLRFRHPLEVQRGMVNLLGSHDTPRVRTVLGSVAKAAQAAVLLLTAEGVPMVYYGDEVGLEGAGDPDCRRCYPWDDRNQRDEHLLSLYRRLIGIRNALPWLNDGAWETVTAEPLTGLYSYRRLAAPLTEAERSADASSITVVLNTGARPADIAVPVGQVDLLAGQLQAGKLAKGKLHLPGHGIAILASKKLAEQVGGRK